MECSFEATVKRFPKLTKEDIRSLKEWIHKQPHLPQFLPDYYLIQFLQCCNFKIERAKDVIETHFTMRTLAPELFQNRDPAFPDVSHTFQICNFAIPEKKDADGNTVFIGRLNTSDTTLFNFSGIFKTVFLISEAQLYYKGSDAGYTYVIDAAGFHMGHLLKVNLVTLKKAVLFIQEAVQIRVARIICINANSALEGILNMAKPFIKKQVADKIFVYSNDKYYEKLPREIFPDDYEGGKGGTYQHHTEIFRKWVEQRKSYNAEFDPLKVVDETKRLGKSKNMVDVFGVEGSFKKLDLD